MAGKKPWDERRLHLQQLLRELREEAGLKQAELASRLKSDQSFVSRYERGERRLDLVELIDICAGCGSTVSQLLARFEMPGVAKGEEESGVDRAKRTSGHKKTRANG